MRNFKIKSYCKINLYLKVTKRLNNGYHNIMSLITFCNLHDVIQCKPFAQPIEFIGKQNSLVYLFNNITEVLTVHGIHLQWGIILGLAVVLIQFRESETCPKTV